MTLHDLERDESGGCTDALKKTRRVPKKRGQEGSSEDLFSKATRWWAAS